MKHKVWGEVLNQDKARIEEKINKESKRTNNFKGGVKDF